LILADENIDFRVVIALRNAGISVISVFEDFRGISDIEVIQISLNSNLIILTEDKDFGEWVFSHKTKNLSVLFLRYRFQDTSQIINVLLKLISSNQKKLFHHFTTISVDKIRIRSI
tara:strand:+ start:41450 stop:41797 length:348 start_codon:yes stop_codon:yes gene_type:complete